MIALAEQTRGELALVRAAAAELVERGDPGLLEGRVYRDRSRAITERELAARRPVVCLWTPGERVDRIETESARIYVMEADLLVEVVVLAQDGAQDLTDRVARVVLEALGADETLGGLVDDLRYQGRRSEWSGEGKGQQLVSALRFGLRYELVLPEHRLLPDLRSITVSTAIGEDGTPIASDELEVEQD